jgi:hypothetical protein
VIYGDVAVDEPHQPVDMWITGHRAALAAMRAGAFRIGYPYMVRMAE